MVCAGLQAHHHLQPRRADARQRALLALQERFRGEGQHHVRHPADVTPEKPGGITPTMVNGKRCTR